MSGPGLTTAAPAAPAKSGKLRRIILHALPFAIAGAIWFSPVPAGLTPQAWHLFAIFITAILSVLLGLLPLLTSTTLAAGAVVLTGTTSPAKAFAGFANTSVLLVVIAFLVARYGDFILLKPPVNAETILLWAIPFATLGLGAVAVVAASRRRRGGASPAAALTEDERQSLERLLAKDQASPQPPNG